MMYPLPNYSLKVWLKQAGYGLLLIMYVAIVSILVVAVGMWEYLRAGARNMRDKIGGNPPPLKFGRSNSPAQPLNMGE